MSKTIQKVAVLGSGVMGAQIAGLLANLGIPSLLYDLNDQMVNHGKNNLLKLKPAPLIKPENIDLISAHTYEKDIKNIRDVDLIIEAVVEDETIKNNVYKTISPYIQNNAILTSNTSGISLSNLEKSLPDNLKERFMITHFFNPPRYMHLLELVRGNYTSSETYKTISEFGENVLEKGIVHAKDTPNFIGNRIGVYVLMATMHIANKHGLNIEEIDALTGAISGRPKSASFRTCDIIGLDTLKNVAMTNYHNAPNDEGKEMFKIPTIMEKLINTGRLGQKSKAGFYKKIEDGSIYSIDIKTGEYKSQKESTFDCLQSAENSENLSERLNSLCYGNDKGANCFWEIISSTLIYSANRIPEISDNVINIDNAIKWGFGWKKGPFEIWDAIGVYKSVQRMKLEKKIAPNWVLKMIQMGKNRFYS